MSHCRYEVIISRDGHHFGTVDLKCNYDECTARERYKELCDKFLGEEGNWKLNLVSWTLPMGREINETKFNRKGEV